MYRGELADAETKKLYLFFLFSGEVYPMKKSHLEIKTNKSGHNKTTTLQKSQNETKQEKKNIKQETNKKDTKNKN